MTMVGSPAVEHNQGEGTADLYDAVIGFASEWISLSKEL
jgi:hypothetical protein